MDFLKPKTTQNRLQGFNRVPAKRPFINRIGYKKGSVIVMTAVFLLSAGFITFSKLYKSKVQLAQQESQPFGSILPEWWLHQYFGESVCSSDACAPEADPDQDKLSNAQEYFYHSDPNDKDSNGNGKTDGQDVAANIDPSRAGDVTFDQVASDENLFAEGLAFNSDVHSMVSQSFDINKANIPLVSDRRLDIVSDSQSADLIYQNQFSSLVNEYFPQNQLESVLQALQTGQGSLYADSGKKALYLSVELMQIPVPQSLVTFHKYNIALYQLVSDVIKLDSSKDTDTPEAAIWFDKTEALLAAAQRLDTESERLFGQ